MHKSWSSVLQRIVFYFLLISIAIDALFPFYWAFSTSFKTENEMFRRATYIPQEPTLKNYRYVLTGDRFLVSLRNSAVVSSVTVLLALVTTGLVVLIFQKRIVAGLTAGAVKG